MISPMVDSRIVIPELRDYERINAELVQRLDSGMPHVHLLGADGHRSLAAGLRGDWRAIVEIDGNAGPELAAALDAPGLTVVCRGAAGAGAGGSLKAGRLVICGASADGLGCAQHGGEIVACGPVGHRAGLNQAGGVLLALDRVGRLAGERQSGGWFFAFADRVGPHYARAGRGGRFLLLERPIEVNWQAGSPGPVGASPAELERVARLYAECRAWTSRTT